MAICIQCGASLDADSRFCSVCGALAVAHVSPTRFCAGCGVPLESDASFCAKCGLSVDASLVAEVRNGGSTMHTDTMSTGVPPRQTMPADAMAFAPQAAAPADTDEELKAAADFPLVSLESILSITALLSEEIFEEQQALLQVKTI